MYIISSGAKINAKRGANMIAVKGTDIKYNFKAICEQVFGGETVIVSRPKNENVVLVSEKKYQEMEKAQRNAEYLKKIDRGIEQMRAGKLQYHELVEVDE